MNGVYELETLFSIFYFHNDTVKEQIVWKIDGNNF